MATKQATQEIDFNNLSLEEIEALEKEEEQRAEKLRLAKISKIQASKQEAFNELEKVVNKYHLNGIDVINHLLNNRKIDFKAIQEIKPVYLVKFPIQKENRKTKAMENKSFDFYEGKRILADMEFAKSACLSLESFKASITEIGKQYLANDETKNIIIDFYNEYKPAQAQKWDGK